MSVTLKVLTAYPAIEKGNASVSAILPGKSATDAKKTFITFPLVKVWFVLLMVLALVLKISCPDCNCHPAGVVAGFGGCGSVPAGELCQCKERVEGRICNKCRYVCSI